MLPWNLAGTFPFGGPFTEGPLTGGAATAAAETGTAGAAAADGPALAPGATLPGFGTPPAAGAEGASPTAATGAGGGAEAGLAPSEHPANPLTAKADVTAAHHRQRMGIERDPPKVDLTDRPQHVALSMTGRNTHLPTAWGGSRPSEGAGCRQKELQSIEVLSDWPSARPASWRSVRGSVSTARNFTDPSTIE